MPPFGQENIRDDMSPAFEGQRLGIILGGGNKGWMNNRAGRKS